MKVQTALCFMLVGAAVQAGPRSSAVYNITTDTVNSGGARTVSAAYTNDGSAGGIAGISIVAAPPLTVKHGFVGQLTEVTALQLTAAAAQLNEGASLQLAAWQLLDDTSFLAVPATSVVWSVLSGPLAISNGGLTTASTVYQNTAASAQGTYLGLTHSLGLTVLNVNLDDLPGYNNDGLDDSWQVQYFGLNNPNAAPLMDPDGDGQNNAFEFSAGLVPTSASSRFAISLAPVPGQSGQMQIIINPRFSDRLYLLKTTPTLGSAWTDLTTFTFSDDGTTRTFTDTSATGAQKFYRVEIVKP